jgi:hypothetical protein
MCKKPSTKEFFTNLKVPMPLGKKIYKLLKNNLIKIVNLKYCCGNIGEPGC